MAVRKSSTTASKKSAAAETKTTTKKTTGETETAAKKTTTRKTSEKVVTKVQFGGAEYDVNEIVEASKAAYKADNKAAIKSVKVYIKPEDKAAYYVINDDVSGKVDL